MKQLKRSDYVLIGVFAFLFILGMVAIGSKTKKMQANDVYVCGETYNKIELVYDKPEYKLEYVVGKNKYRFISTYKTKNNNSIELKIDFTPDSNVVINENFCNRYNKKFNDYLSIVDFTFDNMTTIVTHTLELVSDSTINVYVINIKPIMTDTTHSYVRNLRIYKNAKDLLDSERLDSIKRISEERLTKEISTIKINK